MLIRTNAARSAALVTLRRAALAGVGLLMTACPPAAGPLPPAGLAGPAAAPATAAAAAPATAPAAAPATAAAPAAAPHAAAAPAAAPAAAAPAPGAPALGALLAKQAAAQAADTEAPAAADASTAEITTHLEELFGMAANAPVDVLEIRADGPVYRVTFNVRSSSKTPPTTVFVSRDGKMVFQDGFDLQERLTQMRMEKGFADCMRQAGLHVYGLLSDEATRKQLAEIGGFAGAIFIDCSVGKENCARLGIKTYPTLEFRGKPEAGIKARNYLESLTGCK